MNTQEAKCSLKPLIRHNKSMAYKGKKYPIDFRLIKQNSNYFYNSRYQYKNIDDIIIQEDTISITHKTFQDFILACHNESFTIDDSNYFTLYQLSIRYEVPRLESLVNEYIKSHNLNILYKMIQYKFLLQKKFENDLDKNQHSISTENEEKIISSDILKYIDDKEMIELPVPVLYRIFTQSNIFMNEINESNSKKITEFLFKCLNKHKQEASVLFSNLNLKYNRVEFFSRLVKEFPNVFNIRMIDPYFLFDATKDLLNMLDKLIDSYSYSINQISQLLKENKICDLANKIEIMNENIKESKNKIRRNYPQFTEKREKKKRFYEKLIKCAAENNAVIKNFDEKVDGNVLHLACELENLELVKYIISLNKIDITSKTILFVSYSISIIINLSHFNHHEF